MAKQFRTLKDALLALQMPAMPEDTVDTPSVSIPETTNIPTETEPIPAKKDADPDKIKRIQDILNQLRNTNNTITKG